MNDELQTLIKNLGGKLGRESMSSERFMSGTEFYSSERKGSWHTKDPLGELTEVSETVRSFSAVTWREHDFFLDDVDMEEWTDVELTGASENNEVAAESGRLLLFHIGWEPTNQYTYAFNLLDRSDDPPVYSFDHANPKEASPAFRKLSLFLGSLKTKKMLSTTKRVTEWAELIDAASEAENYKKAIALSKQALKQHPAQPSLATNLGSFYFWTGDQRREEACYRQALELDPEFNDALSNLGNVYARRGEMDKAFDLIKRAIDNDGDDAEAHYSLACAYALSKQKTKMLAALKRAITLEESNRERMLDEVDFAAFRHDRAFTALAAPSTAKTPRRRTS